MRSTGWGALRAVSRDYSLTGIWCRLGLDDRSRMNREVHVRFCESVEVCLPHATRLFTERLWRTVKYEEVYLKDYASPREARSGLSAYLDFYNHRRLHQALDYQTPAQIYFKKGDPSTDKNVISLS